MQWLLSLLTGGVAKELRRAFQAKQDAETEQERIAAERDIARLEVRQANRALGGRLTAIVQAAWAAPFIIYNWKLLVWDTRSMGLKIELRSGSE